MKFEKIKHLRNENNFTQQEVANFLNTHQSNYSKWENGIETIPFEKLFLLSKFYNSSLDYLTGLSTNKTISSVKALDKIIIGKNIKNLCRERQINQIKLAKVLKTSQSTVSALQNGKVLILTRFIYIIAKKYKYSIELICTK
ncbi:MAG: helix-turn-helix transcriptional regulator [Bacilli bacterium]|nr:helix-turn-helix transcriptional regulator [Bacilli bacterium]